MPLLELTHSAPASAPIRTLLVCRSRGLGRELLRSATNAGQRWFAVEPTTLRDIAFELIAPALVREGITAADELDTLALLDEAIDEVLGAITERGGDVRLGGVGFRDAVRNSIEALRLENVTIDPMRAAARDGATRSALPDILAAYEDRLTANNKTDRAGILLRACDMLRTGSAVLPKGRILMMPDLDLRGASGALSRLLAAGGASVLDVQRADDKIAYNFFAAASITDELREVMRRIVAAGLRWDEVEVIATDANVYGSALDALATRLGVPVTYATGLPIERTRAGRAVAGYLRWIEEDFRADLLRALLESGCLEAPREDGQATPPEPVALANRLRRMRVGWSRERYVPAIERALLQNGANLPETEVQLFADDEVLEQESDAHMQAWQQERAELLALLRIVRDILDATPAAIGRDAAITRDASVSVADLAAALIVLLRFVPITTALEQSACDALGRRLQRISETLTRKTDLRAALGTLRERLDMRVPAVSAEEPPPWGSAGGNLHLSDVEHGGWTGRRHTFLIGLDSGRFPGTIVQDPLLTDESRRRINEETGSALATTAQRIDERRARLAALLARLGGTVTISYSAWDASEARKAAPASVMLQLYRIQTANADAAYDDLHRYIGAPVSSVPRRSARLDAADVWLGALAGDGVLLEGEDVVRDGFRGLDRGLRARAARVLNTLNEYSGRVRPRPDILDPRLNHEILVSAKRIETLGACPLRYFYNYVLRVSAPQDPVLEPGTWLDPRMRGTLFHRVFERTLRMARLRSLSFDSPAFETLVYDVLDAEGHLMLEDLPAPSEGVYRRELREMRGDAWAFVEMARRTGDWLDLEVDFGYNTPIEMVVPGGSIMLTGRVDRVDADGDDVIVIDYKTGSTYGYNRQTYNGGRRIQHVLYTHAVQTLLGRRVARMEYHFPSVRGRNETKAYPQSTLTAGPTLIGELLDSVAQGMFPPTEDPGDCKFCDYRAICRVRLTERNDVLEAPSTRINATGARLDAHVALTQLRKRYV